MVASLRPGDHKNTATRSDKSVEIIKTGRVSRMILRRNWANKRKVEIPSTVYLTVDSPATTKRLLAVVSSRRFTALVSLYTGNTWSPIACRTTDIKKRV